MTKSNEICDDCGAKIAGVKCVEDEKVYCIKCGKKHGFDTDNLPSNHGILQKVDSKFFRKFGVWV